VYSELIDFNGIWLRVSAYEKPFAKNFNTSLETAVASMLHAE
jgi:hypothetical protein